MISIILEEVKGTKAAFVPLYAVFTEEQKKLADQLIPGRWAWVRCNDASAILHGESSTEVRSAAIGRLR